MKSSLFIDETLPNISLKAGAAVNCNTSTTPECLKDLYKTKGYVPRADIGNTLGVAGYLEEWASYSDIAQFYAEYVRLDVQSFRHTRLLILSTSFLKLLLLTTPLRRFSSTMARMTRAIPGGGEANLDVQYTGAISYPIPNTYFSTGGRPVLGDFIPDVLTGDENSNGELDWT